MDSCAVYRLLACGLLGVSFSQLAYAADAIQHASGAELTVQAITQIAGPFLGAVVSIVTAIITLRQKKLDTDLELHVRLAQLARDRRTDAIHAAEVARAAIDAAKSAKIDVPEEFGLAAAVKNPPRGEGGFTVTREEPR